MAMSVRPARWKILLAFATIYFVWGSTFLAIRVGVREVPPFLLAALRFTIAGLVLFIWMRLKGEASPSRREWAGACILGCLIFLVDYGCLFWAEKRVPSGIAAVELATIPVFITVLEILFLGTQRLTLRLSLALLLGIFGVSVLMSHSAALGEAPLDHAGALALLVASFTWSVATILTRKLPLPSSKAMSSAAQMLTGGIQLFILTLATGELDGFRWPSVSYRAWLSLAYLITAGSLAGFTAYVWLVHHESPSKVGTYAYVNPVIAVALGCLVGNEAFGLRTLLGTLLILASVVAIASTKTQPRKTLSEQDRDDLAGLSAAEAD